MKMICDSNSYFISQCIINVKLNHSRLNNEKNRYNIGHWPYYEIQLNNATL